MKKLAVNNQQKIIYYSINGIETIGYPFAKNKVRSLPITINKINSSWIKNLSVTVKL